ncbi:MAG: FAD-dependent oxidoreductase, partial [Eggerthellaceae bacterium]|nr:FAD-dependent oxidoreductase [Eggerthellaceae bacterium]
MMKGGISRRSFLAGMGIFGAGAAAAMVGCSPSGGDDAAVDEAEAVADGAEAEADIWAIKELGEPEETITADVAIVGAGGTGTAAAIQAIDLGLEPVVIEREGGYGGSFVGTEGMTALETKYTRDDPPYLASAYYPDQPYGVKNAMNTCLNYHHWIPQHSLYENYFSQTAETIDWLESHG